ncbi:hypothetical protein [Roseitranquillus sediminis]|uniref:hypothetical protein n=1 Tax=Roseitranquillus sediminis TaxID=2809051 RepID=UPI001D0C8930|nr:hypothetical protein [Roseitranquillus sediminis]MBM9593457.1 hypothetical protein [Roseitranquillus sediminis]
MSRTRLTLCIACAATLAAAAADAACYADYKAKRDDPLRLHYGVMEVSDAACRDSARARSEVADRLARADWQLLSVEGTFGDEGLDRRRQSAGQYFLRF